MKVISIDAHSSMPKYRQIIRSIEIAIAENRLKKNEKLPSVNKVCLEFSVSRDTVFLAYEELKKKGVIYAILGKGYYLKSEDFIFEQRLFVLFDELNNFKEELFNSFLKSLDNRAKVDIFFHHFNEEMFNKLVNESNGNYSKYILMPSNLNGVLPSIKNLPKDDVYILDQTNPDLNDYPGVFQNFVKDIYQALEHGQDLLKKYDKLRLVFPNKKEPLGMKKGFVAFCIKNNLVHDIITATEKTVYSNDIDFKYHDFQIKKGEVYIIPNDSDLVSIIEKIKRLNLKIGEDVGIISYNDMPLKKIVENGITTISTSFNQMGQILAQMVLENQKKMVENESRLIIRHSL
jgi:DNA-binding transcriptional regulator YhcF (GntR family)